MSQLCSYPLIKVVESYQSVLDNQAKKVHEAPVLSFRTSGRRGMDVEFLQADGHSRRVEGQLRVAVLLARLVRWVEVPPNSSKFNVRLNDIETWRRYPIYLFNFIQLCIHSVACYKQRSDDTAPARQNERSGSCRWAQRYGYWMLLGYPICLFWSLINIYRYYLNDIWIYMIYDIWIYISYICICYIYITYIIYDTMKYYTLLYLVLRWWYIIWSGKIA